MLIACALSSRSSFLAIVYLVGFGDVVVGAWKRLKDDLSISLIKFY